MTEEHSLVLNFQALGETDQRPLYRDEELDRLLASMEHGIHTFVHGGLGRGKTVTVKRAVEKFNNARTKAVYVSCAGCKTTHAALMELLATVNSHLASAPIHIGTRSNYETVERLKAEFQRHERTQFKVVVLDHIEALQEEEIVDSLLKIGLTVILVSDDANSIAKLSPFTQSYFSNVIHFGDYMPEQVVKILQVKAKCLFNEGHYADSLVEEAAKRCNGNILQGETLLLAAAVEADRQKKHFVDEQFLPQNPARSDPLNEHEKVIFSLVNEQGAADSGKLYKLYCGRMKMPKAPRTFRHYLMHLRTKRLVKTVRTQHGWLYEPAGENRGRVQ